MAIESSTFKFLKDLEKNNNREWFQGHKPQYEKAQQDLKKLTAEIEAALNKKDQIENAKVFRIYRDVRFSKDKAPYKNNFGIHFTRATPQRRGGYYLQIEPGNSFAAGGFWAPEPDDIKRIREEFAFDEKPIRKIISSKSFVKNFGQLHGDELKTAPSGFDREHSAIDLIRKKQWIIMRKFKDAEVMDKSFLKQVTLTFEAMRPFFDYMSDVLSSDLNGQPLLKGK